MFVHGDPPGPVLADAHTNVLVRLMTRDDARQVAAAEAFFAHGAWVPHLAVAEATRMLTSVYGRDAAAVVTSVDMLLRHEHLSVQDVEAVAAAVARFRQHPRFGFSDRLMVEVARRAGHTPLGTFDRGLGRIEGAQRL
jgi:predicted nucleic-acid-binding protein